MTPRTREFIFISTLVSSMSICLCAYGQDEAAPVISTDPVVEEAVPEEKAEPAEEAKPAEEAVDEDEAFLSGGAAPVAEEEPVASGEEESGVTHDDAPADGASEKWGGRLRDHKHQGFVNVLFGIGWNMVAPYDKNDPEKACSELKVDPNDPNTPDGEGEPICSGRSPMHLDLLGGFGVKEGLEIFAMFRLGIPDPGIAGVNGNDETMARYVGAGIKTYSPKDGLFKISFGVAALFDFSTRATETYDLVIHVPIAAHFDFIPWLGAYIQVAPNISFISEFKLDISAGIGLQGRFI